MSKHIKIGDRIEYHTVNGGVSGVVTKINTDPSLKKFVFVTDDGVTQYANSEYVRLVIGWAKRDGSLRTEVPDNPIGWTPLYAWYEICCMMVVDNEDKANARLIAGAPDLLEAAKEVLAQAGEFERQHDHYAALSSAIKRAEGDDA